MRVTRKLLAALSVIGFIACLLAWPGFVGAQESVDAVKVGASDLGGVVTSPNGPEAGVWVIAETTDLPTKFAKFVVTDDRGRYLIPDLPRATYNVWVRGYGLVDSPKAHSEPGKMLNLTAVVAPSESAAAEYYPGVYWYSMLKIPDRSEFPGTGPKGNGIPVVMRRSAIGSIRSRTRASPAMRSAPRVCARFRRRPRRNSRTRSKHGRCAHNPARRCQTWH